tara:strand:- start:451 stop:783 length:333 start_codon:yes stop_codon:yes gene_type:complete
MENKKAVAAFWWVLISLFGIIVFVGVYILFTGTYINDFWRTNYSDSGSVIESGKTPKSSGNDLTSSEIIEEARDDALDNSFLNRAQSNQSSSNISRISSSISLPAPPALP